MEVINGFEKLPRISNFSIITIGNFDGIHLGHQKILHFLAEKAKKTVTKKAAKKTSRKSPTKAWGSAGAGRAWDCRWLPGKSITPLSRKHRRSKGL